jgi:glycosyltransferase involved in cell wall biosynthesis
MHLGVVVTNYPPHMGGVETHVEALAREIMGRGHRVSVICLGDADTDEVRDGVRVLTLRRRLDLGGVLALPDPRDWRAARRSLAASTPTHISVHTRFFPMTWLGIRLARDLDIPAVLTEHGGGHVSASSAAVTAAARVVDRTAGRWALRAADRVLAISAVSAGFVGRLAGREAEVLGNGADAAFWAGAAAQRRRHVVFAGRLVREKGWPDFLRCLDGLPDVTATVAGDGPDRAAVDRAISDLGLSHRVDVTGRLDRYRLRDVYAGSVYVNPSTAAEGFQTTLLEAGLAGARIATYDVGGAAEVVGSHGAPGLVVSPGDATGLAAAVQELLDYDDTGDRGVLEAYDWPAVTDRFLAALESSRR